jgi:uncharacterized protein (DUF2235 family)
MPGKRIVICCDGTGNSFDNLDTESNVAKLYSSLTIDSGQIAYYHPGVGTMGSPKSRGWFDKQCTRVKGLAFGAGTEHFPQMSHSNGNFRIRMR